MNDEVLLTLDDAVAEVLGLLTGLDLTYEPELDRYRAITRQLNRALRHNALEQEWSYYASTASAGLAYAGQSVVSLNPLIRPRIINDDAVRLVDSAGMPVQWAYFLPRDALHKYAGHNNVLKCAITKQDLIFSRAFQDWEDMMEIIVPVMREPTMFRLPDSGMTVPQQIRDQPVDFDYPDVIIARAAYYYAQTDPVMQPRVQTLEEGYKDLMYQLIERDTSHTDTPYINEFILPLENGLREQDQPHYHPHSNFI